MAKKVKIKVDHHEITRVEKGTRRSPQEVADLKKERSRLYSQKSYWFKKWNEATTNKEANRALHKAKLVQREINLVNEKLGITYELPPAKKEGYFEEGVRKKQFNVWEGKRQLRSIIKKRFYTTIIINEKKFSPSTPSKVYNEYEELERITYLVPRTTPIVEFEFDAPNKTVTVNIF